MKAALFVLALALVAWALPVNQVENEVKSEFEAFVKQYERTYATEEEYAARLAIFSNNLAKIKAHNSQKSSFKLGVTNMADLTPSEFASKMGYNKALARSMPRLTTIRNETKIDLASLPDSVDWRARGVISPVKNQGGCGSCWAFASTEVIESHYAIATGKVEVLSPQQITSCTPNPNHCGGTGGCGGSVAQLAFEEIIEQGGLTTEALYPYTSGSTGKTGTCDFDKSATPATAVLSSYVNLKSNDYADMMNTLANVGPVSVTVAASSWALYKGGIFDCSAKNPDLNHLVEVVGYGSDVEDGVEKPYWIVRNSWGPGWGEDGYMRLKRDATPTCAQDLTPAHGSGCDGGPDEVTVCGACGVLYDSTYPVISA